MTTTLTREAGFNPFIYEGRHLNSISFYNEEKILFTENKGWFGSNNNLDSLIIPTVKVKRKADLKHKGAFVLPINDYYGKRYDLFIQVDNKDIKIIKQERKQTDYTYDIRVYNLYTISILGKIVEVEENAGFIRTEKGKELDKWTAILKNDRIDIDSYNLSKLLDKYNLVEK